MFNSLLDTMLPNSMYWSSISGVVGEFCSLPFGACICELENGPSHCAALSWAVPLASIQLKRPADLLFECSLDVSANFFDDWLLSL